MPEARRVDRRLHVHAEDEVIEQELHVPLRLHAAAHEPEAHVRRVPRAVRRRDGAGDGDEARDERVEGALPRRHRVRQPGGEGEAGAAVVEREARSRHHHAGAELVEQRVDERDHVPVLVGDRQVDRLAGGAGGAGVGAEHRLAQVDVAPTLGDEGIRQDRLRLERQVLGVAVVLRQVGVGELLRLDQEVQVRRRVVA